MGKKMSHKRPSDDRKVFLVHSPGNHFTCYRKTSLKPPLQRPGLLLLENHGRAVVGAPKINPELGKPPVSHGPPHSHPSLFLKTTEFKIILTDTAQKSCESSPGTKTKIPGLDLTSKEKKVRDSILHVPEVLPEKPEEAWKRYQGRGFLKKLNKMKEEQDEKVWKEFLAMVKENEDFPNWEIVKRRPKKTQKAHNDGQKKKTMKSLMEGEEQEQDEDEEEKEEWNEPIKNMKTMKTPNKFQREEEEEAWIELLDMVKEMKVEEIAKRRPKRTPRKKVSFQIM